MLRGLTAAACLAALAAPACRAAELKIAVVNMDEILARYKKTEDMRKAEQEKLKTQMKKLAERRREHQKRLIEFETGAGEVKGPDRRKRQRDLEIEGSLLEYDIREFYRGKKLAGSRITRTINDDIAAVCRRIGEAEPYDLILKRYSSRRKLAGDREQLEAFQLSPVLYAAESINITSRVLEALEDAYSRGIRLVPGRPEASKRTAPPGAESSEPAEDVSG